MDTCAEISADISHVAHHSLLRDGPPTGAFASALAGHPNIPAVIDPVPEAVNVRRLAGAHDIAAIQFLREEINLELHRQRDPAFAEHEKKEIF
ncbi:MAG: hypothetical protein JO269_12715 [Burkholderiaceae bacterium]|nr:hypothetical protein [Burkholderiaceae bacterium]